jgi:hypothetical protein
MNSLLQRQKDIEYIDFLARDVIIEQVGDFRMTEIDAR